MHIKYWLVLQTTSMVRNFIFSRLIAKLWDLSRTAWGACSTRSFGNARPVCVVFDVCNCTISWRHLRRIVFTSCTHWLTGTTYTDKQQNVGRHRVHSAFFVPRAVHAKYSTLGTCDFEWPGKLMCTTEAHLDNSRMRSMLCYCNGSNLIVCLIVL
jgi:hypothetical protein